MGKLLSISVSMMLFASSVLVVAALTIQIESSSSPFQEITKVSHAPIRIDGNLDFASQASAEGWSGNGT